jgi:predicted lactoylglutathione lyase
MMFVALKVRDMKKSIKWYTDTLGMQQMPYPKVNMHAETHIQVTCR